MVHRRLVIPVGLLAGVLLLPVTASMQSDGGGRAAAGREWPAVGGDAANARYSTLAHITTANVARLGGAWMSPKFEPAASTRAMAVVRDGMIIVSLPPAVQAFNAKTGASVWRFQAGGGRGRGAAGPAAPPAMGSPAREGVAIGDGLVFAGLSDARDPRAGYVAQLCQR